MSLNFILYFSKKYKMYSLAEENYLKAIYKLSESNDDSVTTNAIAEVLQTKPASVTDMLKRLADKQYINYVKYQGVNLTERGAQVAISIVRKHRLWEVFLVEKLEFKWDEVHEVAEELEHISSEKLIDALDRFLEHPRFDPHGDPIPSKKGVFSTMSFKPLFDLPIGYVGQMCGVKDHTAVFLQYLDKLNLNLGKEITLLERNEYDNSLVIRINGTDVVVSKEVAKNILVSDKNV